jgi:hypothetical protein
VFGPGNSFQASFIIQFKPGSLSKKSEPRANTLDYFSGFLVTKKSFLMWKVVRKFISSLMEKTMLEQGILKGEVSLYH